MANGSHSSSYVPQVNSSSGQVFDSRAVWRTLRAAADEIKEAVRERIVTAATRTAAEATGRLPVYRRKTTRYPIDPNFGPPGHLRRVGYHVQHISKYRVRATTRARYANFVDSRPSGPRQADGRNRGTITPTPAIGPAAMKWRLWMWREIDAIAWRWRLREIR